MKFITVSANEWAYPDCFEYETQCGSITLESAKNSYASIQLLLSDIKEEEPAISINLNLPDGLSAEFYELVPVMVEDNANLPKESFVKHFPERVAPYYLYDCIKPLKKTLTPYKNENTSLSAGLYIAVKVDKNAKTETVNSELELTVSGEKIHIPFSLKVFNVEIPEEENMKMIVGYSERSVAQYHGVKQGSKEFKDLDEKYLKMLRRMRQNMLYTRGIKSFKNDDGHWSFDFSELELFVEKALKLGFKYFNAPSVGGRKSWQESTIIVGPGLESMSYEGYVYLSEYLPALRKFLIEKGYIDMFYMGVADEPNAHNATEFRALCGLVRKFFPEIKLIDAVSYGNLHGALDVWIPLNSEYDKHIEEFESFRKNGEEIWFYVCCGPRSEQYINRFMDYPLLSTRYLFWGNYKYNLGGYLHWAANVYQPNQDPYKCNCPEHRNCDTTCILPAGDTHVMYPGDGEPYMSIRLEAHRASEEDFELFKILAAKNKALADEICDSCFTSFNKVEYNVKEFEKYRSKLLAAAAE